MTPQLPLAAAALCAAISGFAGLGLAMDRHWEDVYGSGSAPGRARLWLRSGGSIALMLSLLASLALRGSTQGWVLWFGVLTLAALAVVLVLSYAPRRTAAAGMATAVGSVVTGAVAFWLR